MKVQVKAAIRGERTSAPPMRSLEVDGRLMIQGDSLMARVRWVRRISERQGHCFWCLFSGSRKVQPGEKLVEKKAPAFRKDPLLFVCSRHENV